MASTFPSSAGTGLLDDPLRGWGNDDLLITAESRTHLQRTHPKAIRVLDWPALRERFTAHDLAASEGKRRSRVTGLWAVFFAGTGVILLSVASTATPPIGEMMSEAALLMVIAGGILAIFHWIGLLSRDRWLGNRFWTERLRQLHFQFLINNLDFAAAAMKDDAALKDFLIVREQRLAEVVGQLTPRVAIAAMRDDIRERKFWLYYGWKNLGSPPSESPELFELMEALYNLRIEIQVKYAALSRGSDIYSPPMRARLLNGIGDIFTVAVVPIAIIAGIAIYLKAPLFGLGGNDWVAALGALSAAGLMARTAEQGLQAGTDSERYEWYSSELDDVKEHFENSNLSGKLQSLRKLELLSYKELRRFILTHSRARFMM